MKQEIAQQELSLNIIHQEIKVKTLMQVGYEYDKGQFIFMLCFPCKIFKELSESKNNEKMKKKVRKGVARNEKTR